MNFTFAPMTIRRFFGTTPFSVVLLTVCVLAYWAVRLAAPMPAPLSAVPLAVAPAVQAEAWKPAAIWQNAASPQPTSIKVLALIGSVDGAGRAVLEIEGGLFAANSGEELKAGWRVVSVRPETVEIDVNGKRQTLHQPMPVAGQELKAVR
jgi:hypothetical protein